MNLLGIDLNLLLVFEAVYLDRNLTQAGERLNLSQPAVSNALKRLRDKLQDPLFIRTADGMVPTAYAESIMPAVAQSLAGLRDCFAARREFEPESRHNFRLMMGDYNGAIVMPRLMQTLAQQAPAITVTNSHIDRNSAYEKLRTGRVDLVITAALEGPGLYQQQLFEDRYVTLAGEHNDHIRNGLNLDRFCELPHVLFSLEGHGRSNVDKALEPLGRKRHIALRVPHVSIIPAVLEQTDYLATLPARVALNYMERYRLRLFETPVELDQERVFQYWHSRQHQDPACVWLRKLLKEQVAAFASV